MKYHISIFTFIFSYRKLKVPISILVKKVEEDANDKISQRKMRIKDFGIKNSREKSKHLHRKVQVSSLLLCQTFLSIDFFFNLLYNLIFL